MKHIIKKLEEYGLSAHEAALYCHLLRLGTVTVGPLVKETSLKKQSIYNALQQLINRGLVVEEKCAGKPKTYTPQKPETLLERQAEQQQQLQNVLLDLETLRGSAHVVGDVEVVRGVVPFQAFLEKQLKAQKEGVTVDVLGAGGDLFLAATHQRAFFTRYENIRLQKKISHRLLMYADQRATNPAYTKRRQVQTKYLAAELLHVPLPVIIWTGGVSLLLFGDEPQIVHMTSKHIRDGYAAQFRALWKMAEE